MTPPLIDTYIPPTVDATPPTAVVWFGTSPQPPATRRLNLRDCLNVPTNVEASRGRTYTSTEDVRSPSRHWWAGAEAFLRTLAQHDWSHDLHERPTPQAIEYTRRIGEALFARNLVPERIAPSVEGGITISFLRGNRMGVIECDNSGEIVFLISSGDGRPDVWGLTPDDRTISEELGRFSAKLFS